MAYAKRNATLPEHLSKLIVACGLDPAIDKGSVWNCHGTPVILHAALERIADHVNIVFEPPQIIEAQSQAKIAVVCVRGNMDSLTAWSIGEATPANNKNEYPWAMAEKRAKDRVILKLIGASGFVYSEEEADSLKKSGGNYIPPVEEPEPDGADGLQKYRDLLRQIDVKAANMNTYKELQEYMKSGWLQEQMGEMSNAAPELHQRCKEILIRRNAALKPRSN